MSGKIKLEMGHMDEENKSDLHLREVWSQINSDHVIRLTSDRKTDTNECVKQQLQIMNWFYPREQKFQSNFPKVRKHLSQIDERSPVKEHEKLLIISLNSMINSYQSVYFPLIYGPNAIICTVFFSSACLIEKTSCDSFWTLSVFSRRRYNLCFFCLQLKK